MENEFYKASNDSAFKSMFCRENNRDLLKELLETSIEKEVEIQSLGVPEVYKNNLEAKGKTLDAVVKAEGAMYLVEMNSSTYPGLNRRNASFAFSNYAEETEVGGSYNDMKNIIQLNYTCGLPKKYPPVAKYELTDDETGLKYIDNFIIYEFNVDKILDACYNGDEKYKFIALLGADEKQLHKMCKGEKIMERFENEITKLNADPEFRSLMHMEKIYEKESATIIQNAKNEGIAEGQAKEKAEIAKNLLNTGLSIEDIIKATNLSKTEIENLK